MAPGGISGPFSIGTKPETRPAGQAPLALPASRSKYGRPTQRVGAEINERINEDRPGDAERPREIGEGW